MDKSTDKTLEQRQSFYQLTPHDVLNASEEAGFWPTGELLQLNSYENRVFLMSLEKSEESVQDRLLHNKSENIFEKIIVKAYRPQRWSQESILEEHQFLQELEDEGLQTSVPFVLKNGSTLLSFNNIFYAFFPRIQGRLPQEFLQDDLKKIGRSIAQIHNVGSRKLANYRPTLTCEYFGERNLDILQNWFEPSLWPRYEDAACSIMEQLDSIMDPDSFIRIHGDCHKGNLIHLNTAKTDDFFFIDFDDFINGPVAQDFWMLFSDASILDEEKELILSGYEELRDFPRWQLPLFSPLRGLRIIQYSAWIASRWQDPSFPQLFPEFNTYNYWAEETESLERIVRSSDE